MTDSPAEGEEARRRRAKASAAPEADQPLEVASWDRCRSIPATASQIFGTLRNNGVGDDHRRRRSRSSSTARRAACSRPTEASINLTSIPPGKSANFRAELPGLPDFAALKFDLSGRGYDGCSTSRRRRATRSRSRRRARARRRRRDGARAGARRPLGESSRRRAERLAPQQLPRAGRRPALSRSGRSLRRGTWGSPRDRARARGAAASGRSTPSASPPAACRRRSRQRRTQPPRSPSASPPPAEQAGDRRGVEPLSGMEDDGALEHVGELPDVARPRLACSRRSASAGERRAAPRRGGERAAPAGADEQRQVARAARRATGSAIGKISSRIEQVGAEGAAGRPSPRGRGWSPRPPARRPRSVSPPPTRSKSPPSSTRSTLACTAERQLADLVEEERAAARPARSARAWRRSAPVKAPRSWPKSSLSTSVSGIAAQLTATNGAPARGDSACSAAREELLAGAALAGQQHRASSVGATRSSRRSAARSRGCRPTIGGHARAPRSSPALG